MSNALSFSVEQRVVIVTGGTGVLGRAMAAGLVQQGARVCIVGRSKDKAEQAVAECSGKGHGEIMYALADVTDERAVTAVVDAVLAKWGCIHDLVNAAGGNDPAGMKQ